MKKHNPKTEMNALPSHYQNEQSEVEKLMRQHLQTPGHIITEEELRALRIGTTGVYADFGPSQPESNHHTTSYDVLEG